jgi:hypothetical protein
MDTSGADTLLGSADGHTRSGDGGDVVRCGACAEAEGAEDVDAAPDSVAEIAVIAGGDGWGRGE